MSYFHVTCPWCGVRIAVGFVGSRMVGDNHACTEPKPCDHVGCVQPGRFAVSECSTGPMGWIVGQGYDFCCGDHIGTRTIFMCQSDGTEPATACAPSKSGGAS